MKYIVAFMLLFSATIFPGFIGETLVKTPSGYTEIAQLKVGDKVFCVNKEGQIFVTIITHAISYDSNQYMMVSFENEVIVVARGQKFFLPLKYVWRKAKKLHEKDALLTGFCEALIIQRLQTLGSVNQF